MGTSPRKKSPRRRSKGLAKGVAGVRGNLVGALFLTVLTAGISCVPSAPKTAPRNQQAGTRTETLTVFFTGNTLGALKPCGCSGGQLGGLERRRAVFDTVPKQERLIIDTGTFVKSDGEQDLIKYNVIIQALQLLDYDLVNLSQKDLDIAENLGLLSNPIVGFISPHGAGQNMAGRFQQQYLLRGEYVTLSVLTLDLEISSMQQIREVFPPRNPDKKSVNVLIVNRCDDVVLSSAAETGLVDCLVCPAQADEPLVVSEPNRKPLVFSVGRYGRHICKVQAKNTGARDGLKLSLEVIPVAEDLPKDASLVSLYKDYQQVVRESNLLEKHPRFAPPDDLEYVGSLSCKPCHDSEYEKWQNTGHAKAYATLEQAGSEADPECVVCHVVGLDYEGGFYSLEKTGDLKDVGCENCHGPGSDHIRTGGRAKSAGPKSACTDCHTPEHSGEYAGNERVFLEKIIHWKEPNTAGHVK